MLWGADGKMTFWTRRFDPRGGGSSEGLGETKLDSCRNNAVIEMLLKKLVDSREWPVSPTGQGCLPNVPLVCSALYPAAFTS